MTTTRDEAGVRAEGEPFRPAWKLATAWAALIVGWYAALLVVGLVVLAFMAWAGLAPPILWDMFWIMITSALAVLAASIAAFRLAGSPS